MSEKYYLDVQSVLKLKDSSVRHKVFYTFGRLQQTQENTSEWLSHFRFLSDMNLLKEIRK
jgi:hypothetical protein